MIVNPAANNISPRIFFGRWLLIGVFIALLWLPTADFFCGFDRTEPAGENRLPAPRPRLEHLDLSGIKHFLGMSEAYFNDHFGFCKRRLKSAAGSCV